MSGAGARVVHRRIGAHNPRSLAILEQLVSINGRRGDPDQARAWGAKLMEAFRELVELSGNDPGVLNDYAWAGERSGMRVSHAEASSPNPAVSNP